MQRLKGIVVLWLSCMLLISACSASNNDAGHSAANTASVADKSESESLSNSEADAVTSQKSMRIAEAPANTGSAGTSNGFVEGAAAREATAKKLIYKANMVMEVEDYEEVQSQIRNLITLSGGYIVEFSENQSLNELGGNFILKVPAQGFSSFMNKLEELPHKSLQQSMQGQDVSEEYVDLEATLKAKEVMEQRYIAFMEKATKTNDLVAFANELGRIQEEIAQIKGRMRYIDNNVAYSTIDIRLYQKDAPASITAEKENAPLWSRAKDALSGSLQALSVAFQWVIIILAGALPVLIVLSVGLFIGWTIRKRTAKYTRKKSERTVSNDEEQQ